MRYADHELTDPEGLVAIPEQPCGTGVLTLAGSSGRVDTGRVRLLAEHGALAMSIRWFGGPGQHDAPYEIALETFTDALDRLAPECDRLVVMGTSFGAEAALSVSARDERVDAAVGFAPSGVVWAGVDGERVTSHWTWRGEPLPFVPLDEDWEPGEGDPSYVGLYRASLRRYADHLERAAIPVERIPEVLLVAGGDDQVWPSVELAEQIVRRRTGAGLETVLVTHPEAGHRVVLPGEPAVRAGARMKRGGSPEADAELGRLAWPHLEQLLHLPLGAADS